MARFPCRISLCYRKYHPMKWLLFLFPPLLVGCFKKDSSAYAPPPVPVKAVQVEVRSMPYYFEEMGVIKARQTAEVKSQVAGVITGIYFEEGDLVKKGDLLFTIDDSLYQIRLKEAKAHLAQYLASLSNVQKKLGRYQSLSKEDLISKVEWDELETKIALCKAQVEEGEAKVAAAALDLEHCSILAPISGHTGKIGLQIGNMSEHNQTLLTLSQEDRFYVDFSLTEQELQKLPFSTPSLQVYAAGKGDWLADGKVTFLDHTIDSHSGMLFARGLLSEVHKPLKAGQSVRVHLFFGQKEEATLIPVKAIKTNQTGPYVFCIKEDQTATLCPVKLGPEEKGMIVIEEGVDKVFKVVTEGHLRLYPGAKVKETP